MTYNLELEKQVSQICYDITKLERLIQDYQLRIGKLKDEIAEKGAEIDRLRENAATQLPRPPM